MNENSDGQHRACTIDMIHLDGKNDIVTTPAYILGPSIKDVAKDIEKLVANVLELAS
ncbi:MAG: hypothetical protein JSW15_04635 [Deltaproteobacteria bacterium]|nr:MAG: hypothetical protein JSW15_04635 [Deltaproteobacteria bacterium]